MAAKKHTKRTRLSGSKLRLAAHELYRDAEIIDKRVPDILRRSPVVNIAYTIRNRVKSPERILNKIGEKRKDPKKWGYGPKDITDAAGIRIITLFQNDIPNVVKSLIELHDRQPQYAEFPFARNGLKEIAVYSNRPDGDPLSIEPKIREIARAAGYENLLQPPTHPETGYSSVHFVVDIDVHESAQTRVPMEIQVRDIFEEAWGEIDHKLRYKPDGTWRQYDDPFVQLWLRNLNALKTHCDGCSQHAWIIKERPLSEAERMHSDEAKQVESPQEAIQFLTDVVDDPKMQRLIHETYGLRARADLSSDRFARKEMFAQTERAFDALIRSTNLYSNQMLANGRTVGFYLTLEKAFCQYSQREPEAVDTAIATYTEMLDKNSNDPVIHYRLASALGLKGERERNPDIVERSIELFQRAQFLIGKSTDIDEKHWIRSAIPRNTGYDKWLQADFLAPNSRMKTKRLALLLDAVNLTKKAHKIALAGSKDREILKAINNLTYYVWQYLKIDPNGVPRKISRSLLERYANAFIKLAPIEFCDDTFRLETICQAFWMLKKYDITLQAASRGMTVFHERALRRSNKSRIQPDELRDLLRDDEKPIFLSFISAYQSHPAGILGAMTVSEG